MRSLLGWCLNPSSFAFTWPSGPPNISQLTSLSQSFVNVEFLVQILERTPNLKKQNWEWKHIPDIDSLNTDMIDLGRFVETMKSCQNTLEDLTMNCFNTQGFHDMQHRYIDVQGSLNGVDSFANIKRIKAPFTLLLPD